MMRAFISGLLALIGDLMQLLDMRRHRDPDGSSLDPSERFLLAVRQLARAATPGAPGCLIVLAVPPSLVAGLAIAWLLGTIVNRLVGPLAGDQAIYGALGAFLIAAAAVTVGSIGVLRNARRGWVDPMTVLATIVVADVVLLAAVMLSVPAR